MKIFYRESEQGIEVVRCYGSDPDIILPDRINEKPLIAASPYAFSAGKDREDENVSVFETDDHRMFRDNERLLAGNELRSIVFPDSMESLGRYIFYGCRNLEKLSFSDQLTNIGSGAFTGCRSLNSLRVNMTQDSKSCVKEILGDLWQRIDVVFLSPKGEARLVFPEHYEEAVENTPARILFTRHHGSGNDFRQCFYNKETDYRKYDSLFSLAKARESERVLTELAFSRLLYPVDLTQKARQEYEDYIRENALAAACCLIDLENEDAVRAMSRFKLWSREAITGAAEYALQKNQGEILSFLMNEKNRLFPAGGKKYEL